MELESAGGDACAPSMRSQHMVPACSASKSNEEELLKNYVAIGGLV